MRFGTVHLGVLPSYFFQHVPERNNALQATILFINDRYAGGTPVQHQQHDFHRRRLRMRNFMDVQPVGHRLVAAPTKALRQMRDMFGHKRHVIEAMFIQHRLGQGQFQQRINAEGAEIVALGVYYRQMAQVMLENTVGGYRYRIRRTERHRIRVHQGFCSHEKSWWVKNAGLGNESCAKVPAISSRAG
ncbi:hypothetical protein BN874_2030009 [Candidatus Contendobacter odensis Run_B_J11]|uniref:Uncharacterized protein n=1 Tax=Candidatus Contendobacter odensis Run_B_J11 TaxID=1400861 RepID=A0A7U7J3C2_9GAMM|nr:hypothetical protein BN874_2030009 [Candidatus Contendobacter odensis Run_B_J11]